MNESLLNTTSCQKIFLSIAIIVVLSSCTTLSPLGSCCIMINEGLSGENLVLSTQMKFDIDSVFVSCQDFNIDGFDLLVYSRNGNASFTSSSNKITPDMKIKIYDDPQISRLIFTNFKISGNQKILKNSYFKNKKIEVTFNNCPICP